MGRQPLSLIGSRPIKMSTKQIPTNRDVLLHFYHTKEVSSSGNPQFNAIKMETINIVKSIYDMIPQPIMDIKNIDVKLRNLVKKYDDAKKNPKGAKAATFLTSLDELFDVSKCKCPMVPNFSKVHRSMTCSCPVEDRIHQEEYEFIADQRGNRQMMLSSSVDSRLSKEYEKKFIRRQNRSNPSTPGPSPIASPIISPEVLPTLPDHKQMTTRGRHISYGGQLIEPGEEYHFSDITDNSDDFCPPPVKLPKLKLMDSIQSASSDKKLISNRGLSEILTNDAKKMNAASTEFEVPSSSHMLAYRQRLTDRARKIEEQKTILANLDSILLQFDGKKVFNRERLVVVAQFIDETGERCEEFVGLKSFLKEDTISGERVFNSLVEEMFPEVEFLDKVECIMSDTTSLNTGCRKGICVRLQKWFKTYKGRDVHAFECQLHVNELFLTHHIKEYEGDTKAPNKMKEGSVYNMIEEVAPEDLTEETKTDVKGSIKMTKLAEETLDKCLNLTSQGKAEGRESVFRGDHLRLLVLTCAYYRDIPSNLIKFLYHQQETMSQSRWCTTASGYLRIDIFDVFELDIDQSNILKKMVSFIVNIYTPMFVRINMNPRVPDGPTNILFCRDLMKQFGVSDAVKTVFLSHAEKWLSPQNAAVTVHKAEPPVLIDDLKKIRTLSVNTQNLCWGKKDIKSFLTVESSAAPCLARGSPEFWRNVDNHNRSCERYVGKMSNVLKKGFVKDTKDFSLDNRVRGYVLNMES